MPYLETVAELAEALADLAGIYQQGIRFAGMTQAETRAHLGATQDWDKDHADDCLCRACWCDWIERRIRAAVANEAVLARLKEVPDGPRTV